MPRRLEIEAGASAQGPDFSTLRFDCFDGVEIEDPTTWDIEDRAACVGNLVSSFFDRLFNGTKAQAWLWFDTGRSPLSGNVSYTKPLGSPFDPLVVNLAVPTITVEDGFVDVNTSLNVFNSTFTAGKVFASCGAPPNQGSLSLSSGVSFVTPNVDIDLGGFIEDVADLLDIDVPDEVVIPDIDFDFTVPVLTRIC